MTVEDFIKSPWVKSNIHKAYASSFLHMRPAPEYATGEVVLASTYRHVGFSSDVVSEAKVPSLGREFQKKMAKGRKTVSSADIDTESWQRLVTGTLRSPKQPNQTAKRFLQISPVVPDATLYSLSARLSANSWNPGALVARILQFGNPTEEDAQEHWNQLFHALSVDEHDDIWARFLQQEFESWRGPNIEGAWSAPRTLTRSDAVSAWHKSGIAIPATQFAEDLPQVLSLKKHLTRRQWISMLEAMLRLGTASHILWLCQVNIECFTLLRNALDGKPAPSNGEIARCFSVGNGYWRYGQYAAGTINNAATGFIKARAGINLLLHQLERKFGSKLDKDCLSNIDSIADFLFWLGKEETRREFDYEGFRTSYQDVIEFDQRLIAGKKGISANVKEFLRHVLGQRQTAEAGLDSYDQGFYLAKRGRHKSARWVVSLGPVSVLALVHVCTHNAYGPRTIVNLCQHLGEYGIDINAQEVSDSMLGKTLRNLGLVLDSPDAEGGIVLVNPFELMKKKEADE